jgi:hypothetical protein
MRADDGEKASGRAGGQRGASAACGQELHKQRDRGRSGDCAVPQGSIGRGKEQR